MPKPAKNWFGGPMSAAVYDTHDHLTGEVVTKVEIRNDKVILPPDAKVQEIMHSKDGDTEEAFFHRALTYVLPKEYK